MNDGTFKVYYNLETPENRLKLEKRSTSLGKKDEKWNILNDPIIISPKRSRSLGTFNPEINDSSDEIKEVIQHPVILKPYYSPKQQHESEVDVEYEYGISPKVRKYALVLVLPSMLNIPKEKPIGK